MFRAGPDLPAAEHTRIGLMVQEFAGDGQEVARKYLDRMVAIAASLR